MEDFICPSGVNVMELYAEAGARILVMEARDANTFSKEEFEGYDSLLEVLDLATLRLAMCDIQQKALKTDAMRHEALTEFFG